MTREEAIKKIRRMSLPKETMEILEALALDLAESEDEKAYKRIEQLIRLFTSEAEKTYLLAYLEKQKETSKAIEIVDRIDKFIDERLANAHEMSDSDPDKKYYLGWDNALGKIGGILQDVYSEGKEKESLRDFIDNFPYSDEQKPAEWSEDWREEDIQTRFAFYTYKDDPSVLYLSNVFVEEASRNHGFGTRILRAAEKVAETIGATTISLKVKQNTPANTWYRKNGYGFVAFEDGYDWLGKNLEYMKPNEPEWSETDEWYLKVAINSVEHYLGGDSGTFRWLKALPGRINPQPRQEQPEVEGVVHHSLEAHWIIIDDKKKLATVLKKFSEGTKVKIMIAKEDEK